jgi:uncharacterized membrane protein
MASAPTPTPAASSGMTNNVAGMLCYIPLFLVGLIISIVFLVLEPYSKNRFVRFHAFQSIFLHVASLAIWIGMFILSMILGVITKGLSVFLMGPLMLLIWLGILVLMVVLMIKAYGNQELQLPVIGGLAAKQAGQ